MCLHCKAERMILQWIDGYQSSHDKHKPLTSSKQVVVKALTPSLRSLTWIPGPRFVTGVGGWLSGCRLELEKHFCQAVRRYRIVTF